MAYVRVIAQFEDMTTAEVIFNNAHGIFTTVTSSAYIVARWINEAVLTYGPPVFSKIPQVVGLHIERSRPNSAIALIQLCVGSRCLIYQLLQRNRDAPLPGELYAFLSDNRFLFAGVAAEEVMYALRTEYGFAVRNALDLGEAASRWLRREDLRWAGLERLARELMGFVIDKTDELLRSEWRERVLHPQQVFFACTDAFVSYELGRILGSWGLHPFLGRIPCSVP